MKPVEVTEDMQPKDITEEMWERFDPETIKWILMNPNAYMGPPSHYDHDRILEEQEWIKWERYEKDLVDDSEEWNENFE